MSIIGKTLGHYKIGDQPLGKGGMGEVYRAKDQKLGRDVAIKVLPEEFARDADRVARFQREAKLLASLNHPNIAAIYGLEESGGIQFLVLELVEGDTLADQLKRGPIPVEESLKLALQIAEALEAAHEKGVIHRDLKPANIKVTPDGKVKVLDFGLAKAFAGEQADLNLSNSPTLSNAATQQGVILGTAAYMSPEQARGKSVDKRADIWAFGCVLYEMLTGKQTWAGVTVTDILASALAKEPDFSILPPNIHSDIQKLLHRCLQKDPMERLRDAGDIRGEIKHILADPKGVLAQQAATAEHPKILQTIFPWIAAVVIFSVITGAVIWNLGKPEPPQVMRFEYELPEGQQFNDRFNSFGVLGVSPDGRQFVYSTAKGLYLRSMDEFSAKLIPGTEDDPMQPFFSPDGRWIAYCSLADAKLKKISVNGGAPVALCNVGIFSGGRWNTDNTIVYGQGQYGIMRVSANGGTPESLVKLKGERLLLPQILPDGKSLLYSSITGDQRKVMVKSLKSGESKELFAGSVAWYLPTGHITYRLQNDSNLFAIPFDLKKLEVAGGPVPIVGNVRQHAISDSGTLVYIPGARSATSAGLTLAWVNREGKEEPLSAAPNEYGPFRISPDGMRVALGIGPSQNDDIWIWDVVRETMTRLTFDPGMDNFPLWTPDGKRIVYNSNHEGGNLSGILSKAADGTGEIEKLGSPSEGLTLPWSWSKDGKTLVLLTATLAPFQFDIGVFSMEGNHARKPLLKEKYSQLEPRVSPDGRWMAYTSNESGKKEIYVRPFPEVNNGKWQVSTSGGNSPLWAPDGRELFYRSGDVVMAVSVETAPAFKPGKPKVLFRGTYYSLSPAPQVELALWDISPDGKRFLMMKPPASAPSAGGGPGKINVVVNWTEELKQRVPGHVQ